MRYLLDTNVVIGLFKGQPTLSARIRRHAPDEFGVSAIGLQELFYGAFKSQRGAESVARVDSLQFEVVAFDPEDARHAGEIRAFLTLAGAPVGPYDVLIAGQARARDLVLLTRNRREFQRVPGLAVEDWEQG